MTDCVSLNPTCFPLFCSLGSLSLIVLKIIGILMQLFLLCALCFALSHNLKHYTILNMKYSCCTTHDMCITYLQSTSRSSIHVSISGCNVSNCDKNIL